MDILHANLRKIVIVVLEYQTNTNRRLLSFLNPTRLFGFVARKQGSTTDNVSHLFAELDPDQPASAIVSFASKMMKRWNPRRPNGIGHFEIFLHHRCVFVRLDSMMMSFFYLLFPVVSVSLLSLSFSLPCWFVLTLDIFGRVSTWGIWRGSRVARAEGSVMRNCGRDKHGGHWREEMYKQGNLY